MKKLILFGASELSEQIIRIFPEQVHCCLVSDEFLEKRRIQNKPVFGLQDWLENQGGNPHKFVTVVCMGYNTLQFKEKIVAELSGLGFQFGELHIAQDLTRSRVDELSSTGNIFFADVGVEIGCNLGTHNIFWSRSHICHDVKIGSYNFFATGSIMGGRSEIGSKCFFGFNSVVDSGVIVRDSVTLGANSFLKESTVSNATYLGTPAKIKSNLK